MIPIYVGLNVELYNKILEKNKILVEDIQECLFDFFNNNAEVFTQDRLDTTAKYPEEYGIGIICSKNSPKIKTILMEKYNVINVNLLHLNSASLNIKAQISIELLNNNVMSNITFNLFEIPNKNADLVNKDYFKPIFRFVDFNAGVTTLIAESYIIYEVINDLKKKEKYSGDFKHIFFDVVRFIDSKEDEDIIFDGWLGNYFNISSNRIDIEIKGNEKISSAINLFFKIKEAKIESGHKHGHVFTKLNKDTKNFLNHLLIKKEDLKSQFSNEDLEVYHITHDEKLKIDDYNFETNYDVFKPIS